MMAVYASEHYTLKTTYLHAWVTVLRVAEFLLYAFSLNIDAWGRDIYIIAMEALY